MATIFLNESSDKLTIANISQYKTIAALKTYIATTLKDTLLADEVEDMEFTTNEDRIITDYKDIGKPFTKKNKKHSTSKPFRKLSRPTSQDSRLSPRKGTSQCSPPSPPTCSRNSISLSTYSTMDSKYSQPTCSKSMT